MHLTPGMRLDHYEIAELIGKGGMSEVYRATDTRLHREVAIKVSAQQFTERFAREARTIGSLNHPGICTLHDVGPNYLVMELVEGSTLADRIKEGPLSLDEASGIAQQIADAVDCAHDKGIVHRDLKPGNIKIRPDGVVKVLDFGLAKVDGNALVQSDDSPTITFAETEPGMILGTAAYMAPEQALGKAVDKRADIWAFGVVFYEMLAGERPHKGDSLQELMASVLRDEPRWDRVPTRVHRLLKRCLEKDPNKRLRHIGDVMLLLDEVPSGPTSAITPTPASSSTPVKTWRWPVTAAVLFVLPVAAVALWAPWRSETSGGQAARFEIGSTDGMAFINAGTMTVSPDGQWMVFPAAGADGITRFWLRSLDKVEARALPGTETDALVPPASWSWDSRYVVFSKGTTVKKIDIQGGPPQTLADLPRFMAGAAWNRDGVIVVGMNGGPLLRFSASGGMAIPATTLDKNETSHSWPQFLPDGRHFLYLRVSADPNKTGVYIGSIDAQPTEQSTTRILASNRQAYYAAAAGGGLGHLVFMRESAVMAQPFHPGTTELSGEPAAIAEGVDSFGLAAFGQFSVSNTGTLVYRGGATSRMSPTWFDPRGNPSGVLGNPGEYANPAVSPDGVRVAVAIGPAASRDIWILAPGTATRFTFDPAPDDNPVWSPDGLSIVFSSERSGRGDLYIKPADGSAEERLLFKSDEPKAPTRWSSDGRFLFFGSVGLKTAGDIWVLPMRGDAKPFAIVHTQFNEMFAQDSPDGRWIAYASPESGAYEIYVRPFSPEASDGATGLRWMVSKGTGNYPRWRSDGRQLLYTSLKLEQMAVDVDTSKGFQYGTPRRLFAAPPPLLDVGWDLHPDGERFLFVSSSEGARTVPFTVVLNWAAGLKD